MTDTRRPISARNAGWAQIFPQWLSSTGITPNQISILSVIFAIGAGVCLWLHAQQGGAGLLIAAIAGIQLRLLCNLFDGMVAMEGGKAGPDGPFWNEFPDRAADIAVLVGVGYAAGDVTLGWIAGALAVFVAYTRELGRANGLPADFGGPMAKPHRMVAVCLAAIVAMTAPLWSGETSTIFTWTLYLIIAGSILTIALRACRQIRDLKSG